MPIVPRFFLAAALTVCAGLGSSAAWGGAQNYEPMAASVRTALAAAVAERSDPEPQFRSVAEKIDWLDQMSARLPRRWKPDYRQRIEFLKAVRYEAQRAGLEPELVLGLIEVESNFRKYAVSSAGARGYMQVMPFWTDVIGDRSRPALFDMRANLRYGSVILRHYLDIENGDLFRALGRYNGSLGRAEYPQLVQRAWDRWKYRPAGTFGGVTNVAHTPGRPPAAPPALAGQRRPGG